jgi:hypothetical protein
MTLRANERAKTSIQHHVNEICRIFNKKCIAIYKSHIVLRANDKLPLLTVEDNGWTGKRIISHTIHLSFLLLGSHLCDTGDCVSEKHIKLERFDVNYDRSRCSGVILLIRPATSTSLSHIVKAKPCPHGNNHCESPNDPYRFSCRKIKITFLNTVSLNFLNKLYKK